MYALHGFMIINALVDNRYGVVSTLGELSAVARTYALDKREYTLDNFPQVKLIAFNSVEDGADAIVPEYVYTVCISMATFMAKQAINNVFVDNLVTTLQNITEEYKTQIINASLGKMRESNGHWMPEFIEFTVVNAGTKNQNKIKLWFADGAFRQQYPFYNIVVVPPIENIDDFIDTPAIDIDKVMNTITQKAITDKINELADDKPYTNLETLDTDWTNRDNFTDLRPVAWTTLVYGGIGTNNDIIRDAIASYILSQSKHDKTIWEKVFPDIFIPTEYMIVPFWQHYALPNQNLIAGIHSPVVLSSAFLPFVRKSIYGYSATHVNTHTVICPFLYKSILAGIVGHPDNRLGPIRFNEKWPKYTLIDSTSLEFGRMPQDHQLFIVFIGGLLHWADNADHDTDLPNGYARVKRGEIYYMTATFERIQYLVPMKWNYVEGKLK